MKSLFSARVLLVILGLVLLAVFIVVFGPWVGLDEPWEQVVAILAIALVPVAWLVYRRKKASRATDTLMAGVAQSGAGDAGRASEEARQLRERFEEAVGSLTQSQRKGRGLYDMPWYVFIGAPGSGKTTALVNSGLKFPLEQRIGKGALRGVGGTRNCDWWFTDEAVFLDTAGRYTTQDSDAAADSAAWAAFLKLLRQYRKRRPLNGVILTISAQDLMTLGPDGRTAHIAAARRRLDELNQELRVRLPVYVFVTKCDLVDGFTEYFGDLTVEGRAQVWGITFSQQDTERGQAAKVLGQELDALMVRLNERLFGRLEEEVDARRRTKVFGFPQQMAALRPLVDEFVSEVFGSTRFDKRVLLRGVYFTSGTQEGTPLDRLLSSIGRRFGMAAEAVEAAAPGRGKAFFIEGLLKNVLIGESGLAGLNWRQELRLGALALAAYVAMALLAVLGVILLLMSYRNNSNYLADISDAIGALDGTQAVVDGQPLQEALPRLKQLGTVSSLANQHRGDVPWLMRSGLYQGGSVGDKVREIYVVEGKRVLPAFLGERFEQRLSDPMTKPEDRYAYLKAYLMLGQPQLIRDDPSHLALVAGREWPPDEPEPSLAAHLQSLLEDDVEIAPQRQNEAIVAESRSSLLNNVSKEKLAYIWLKNRQASDPSRDIRLDSAIGSGAAAVMRRRTAPLSEPVPYMFTVDGFRDITGTGTIEAVVKEFGKDFWVLEQKTSLLEQRSLTAGVVAEYEKDYIATWESILDDIEFAGGTNLATALGILSRVDSPLKGLLNTVDKHTYLLKPPDEKAPTGWFTSAWNSLTKKRDAASREMNAVRGLKGPPGTIVTRHFDPYHKLATGTAVVDALVEPLKVMHRITTGAGGGGGQKRVSEVARESEWIQAVETLNQQAQTLPAPLKAFISQISQGARTAVAAGAENEVMSAYRQDVQEPCSRLLAGRFPFSMSSREIRGQDFARLFGGSGIFDKFFADKLEPWVNTTQRPWACRSGGPCNQGLLHQFALARKIGDIFFQSGAVPRVGFTLTMSDAQGGATKVVLEIDGTLYTYEPGTSKILNVQAVWPDKGPPRAQATFHDGPFGTQSTLPPLSDSWAWFRFVDAYLVPGDSTETLLLNVVAGPYSVKIRIRPSSINNPLTDRSWREFRCESF